MTTRQLITWTVVVVTFVMATVSIVQTFMDIQVSREEWVP